MSTALVSELRSVGETIFSNVKINRAFSNKTLDGVQVLVFFQQDQRVLQRELQLRMPDSWVEKVKKSGLPMVSVDGSDKRYLVIRPYLGLPEKEGYQLEAGQDITVRETMGAAYRWLVGQGLVEAEVLLFEHTKKQLQQALIGLDLASYRFKDAVKKRPQIQLYINKFKGRISQREIEDAASVSGSVNIARHLVNLPPNRLFPESYATLISQYFSKIPNVKTEIWNEARLKKEKMGLLLAVGQGAEKTPRLVIIKYRPRGVKNKTPIAFVGKGITFDSGGLDIKPADGMRLMKKDMGGSAAVVGICNWVVKSGLKQNVDFYLSLAENAVSGSSFRPSDVVEARNGMSVEIHNTDAEGRLALADALDLAIKQKVPPRLVVDIATLTGAVKVGLGVDVAGLFSNDDKTAQKIQKAGEITGDRVWRLPLIRSYQSKFNSNFADMVNAVDGFGGAINAALFLKKFVGSTAWVHLDIYAWKDSISGCFAETGGSGQAVQCMIEYLKNE